MRAFNQIYRGETIRLEFHEFKDCTFEHCKLMYGGYGPLTLTGCHFNECKWIFVDAAANTMKLLTELYHSGGKEVVEEAFENIREGELPSMENGADTTREHREED